MPKETHPLAFANSFLFVSGSQPARIARALGSAADAVIIDLEDAVIPDDKERAREAVADALAAADAAQRGRLLVRINAPGSRWFSGDVQQLAHWVDQGMAGAVIPKADDGASLQDMARRCGPRAVLIPLVETVSGMDALNTLASQPQVLRLAFGHLDFQLDAGMQCDRDEAELLPVRMQLVLASRRHGLAAPIDGVTVQPRDTATLQSDAQRSVRMGFGGKLCIHPAQIETVHQVFAPSGVSVAHATAVLQAMEDAQGGVCVVAGRMVDAPVVELARQTLRRHALALRRGQPAAGRSAAAE